MQVRAMKPEELELIPRFWSEDVGIPMELNVMKRWYLLDPEGFRVAVDTKNRIVGMAVALKQCDNLFLMGYLGVSIRYRNNGVARLLLKNLISRSPTANYGLSASADKLDMFFRRGFQKVENTYAFAYIGKFCDHLDDSAKPTGVEVVTITAGDGQVADLAVYDQVVNGFTRNLELILLGDPASTVMAVKQEGKIIGFGKMQYYILGGAWLGPVYADNARLARVLINALLRSFHNKKCPYLFTIISDQARPLLKSLSLKFTDKLTRCYLKQDPKFLPSMKIDRVFAFDDPGFALL